MYIQGKVEVSEHQRNTYELRLSNVSMASGSRLSFGPGQMVRVRIEPCVPNALGFSDTPIGHLEMALNSPEFDVYLPRQAVKEILDEMRALKRQIARADNDAQALLAKYRAFMAQMPFSNPVEPPDESKEWDE